MAAILSRGDELKSSLVEDKVLTILTKMVTSAVNMLS